MDRPVGQVSRRQKIGRRRAERADDNELESDEITDQGDDLQEQRRVPQMRVQRVVDREGVGEADPGQAGDREQRKQGIIGQPADAGDDLVLEHGAADHQMDAQEECAGQGEVPHKVFRSLSGRNRSRRMVNNALAVTQPKPFRLVG